ncbi:MAG: hypothetical protein JO197_17810 [Acidobacteria bacterium]|nr:hypothetical protein [Acidobacteriota bacterium]MBV9478961.1 hypothetical protein [Acidobacteriota bacterium]
MKRKKELIAKLATGFEKVVKPATAPQTWNLFAMAAFRVLTGQSEPLPAGWNEAAAEEAVAQEGASAVDHIELLAFRELAGRDASDELRKLDPPIDQAAESIDVTMAGLAVAMTRGKDERQRWIEAALARPYRETEQVYLFEMLSLLRTEPGQVEMAANAVALAVQSNLVRRDAVTVAPLVCALATIARRAKTTARELLHDRLAVTDELLFAGDQPRFTCDGPRLEGIDDTACSLQLEISGEGTFDAGCDPAAPVTRFLSKHLTAELLRPARRKNASSIKKALAGGTCTTVLQLAPTIALAKEHEQFLRQRVDAAWDCARQQLRGIGCRNELTVEQ